MSEQPERPIQFGPYLLEKRLAKGGMAEIFRGVSSGPHGFRKTVVVKRILPERASDPKFIEMFIREARIMVRLNHPNIVQVLDFGEVDGRYYLAMEYIRGTDGGRLLQSCAKMRLQFPIPVALHIVTAVLDALDYANTLQGEDDKPLGIVHRDVSPSNVFISRLGEVKLADFGLATLASGEDPAEAGIIRGKYGYLAPEVVLRQPSDHRADVFAAGILLAEILMVRRLFQGKNYLDVLLQIRDAKLDRLHKYGKKIPEELRQILYRALARDPNQRYQTAGAFRDALQHFLFEHRQLLPAATLRRFVQKLFKQTGHDVQYTPTGSGFEPLPVPAPTARLSDVDSAAPTNKVDVGDTRTNHRTHGGADFDASVAAQQNVVAAERNMDSLPPPETAGRLDNTSLISVMFHLAVKSRTGLLVLKNGKTTKEVYLVQGDPEFVVSNDTSELFGQYLLSQGVLDPQELNEALRVMPEHDGRLGETLVSLGLLRPMQMLRLLTHQVRSKLLTAFAWSTGTFSFHPEATCDKPSIPLGLDAFEVIWAAIQELPNGILEERITSMLDERPTAVFPPPVPPDRLRLGSYPREIYERLDGATSLDVLLQDARTREEWRKLAGMVYMLVQCGLATIDSLPNRANT